MINPKKHKLWIGFWAAAICVLVFPINNFPLRTATLLLLALIYLRLVFLLRKNRTAFITTIIISVLAITFLIFPGNQPNQQELREAYLSSLRSYEGTRYVWGGENKLGIDCSGLVRASLIKANLKEGILSLNPELLRQSFSLWWHDCSAKSLSEGYRNQTKRIFSTSSLNTLTNTQIEPGDLAVTTSGVHVLAYLGNNDWIEADPDLKRVVIVRVPTDGNPWFQEPVHIMRWAELEPR